jgi:GDP-D-mannose 3', 5'-epimerase
MLTRSEFAGPVNIGSEEMVTINQLAAMVTEIAGKRIKIINIPGPTGVRGRNSHNELFRSKLGWAPDEPLSVGLEKTYAWISQQVERRRGMNAAA